MDLSIDINVHTYMNIHVYIYKIIRNFYLRMKFWNLKSKYFLAKSNGAAEYTDCIFAKGLYSPIECPGYDTK